MNIHEFSWIWENSTKRKLTKSWKTWIFNEIVKNIVKIHENGENACNLWYSRLLLIILHRSYNRLIFACSAYPRTNQLPPTYVKVQKFYHSFTDNMHYVLNFTKRNVRKMKKRKMLIKHRIINNRTRNISQHTKFIPTEQRFEITDKNILNFHHNSSSIPLSEQIVIRDELNILTQPFDTASCTCVSVCAYTSQYVGYIFTTSWIQF